MPEIKKSAIAGKKILFFASAFFGYETKIADKMRELGASVDAFDVRSVQRASERALLKLNPRLFDRKTETYYGDIYLHVRRTRYDYVLFVKCDMPTERVLRLYRKRFRQAKFCLHMWDSVGNIPNVKKKFSYFDFISSFDPADCRRYSGFYFRPLYYCDEYRKKAWTGSGIGAGSETGRKENQKNNSGGYDHDLCFIGTVHSDRWKILKELKRQADECGLRVFYYPYLQSRFIYWFYKLTKPEFRDADIGEFRFERISGKETAQIVDRSRAVIDIQHPGQTGLTIRTIEMTGMNKKMLTTNADIRNYDFYDPQNIKVISRGAPRLDPEWMVSPGQPLEDHIYRHYSLESWIYGVLGLDA